MLGVMRALLLILLSCVAMPDFALAHVDRGAHPQSFTVRFESGESVTFTISEATITALSIRIGKSVHSVPKSECAKLRDVRFDSIMLLWNGSYKTAAVADYFYIQFLMGSETERESGRLPLVRVVFRSGKFWKVSVMKIVEEDTSQEFKR